MNIFVLDTNPAIAARFHNDRHVTKMILECAQLMSTAHVYLDGQATAEARVPIVLRPGFVNHPCTRWVRKCSANYVWAHELMGHLLVEFNMRYGHHHSYRTNGTWDALRIRPLNLPVGWLTPFAQAMPLLYKRSNAVQAYRLYYFNEKQALAQWRAPAEVPAWWHEMAHLEQAKAARESRNLGLMLRMNDRL